MKSIVFMSQAGCLIPLLMMGNLLFGWMFFKPLTWLAIEGILIALFLVNAAFFSRRIASGVSRRSNVIDVEGEIVEERKKLH